MTYSYVFFHLQFLDIGIVTSVEVNHKQVESARKGQEVCIKIEPIPGESPKMFGRHFEETDMLVSKVSSVVDEFRYLFRFTFWLNWAVSILNRKFCGYIRQRLVTVVPVQLYARFISLKWNRIWAEKQKRSEIGIHFMDHQNNLHTY